MAKAPTLPNYVSVIMQLFAQFMQHRIDKESIHEIKLLTYCTRSFIIFFIMMQFWGIYGVKTQ